MASSPHAPESRPEGPLRTVRLVLLLAAAACARPEPPSLPPPAPGAAAAAAGRPGTVVAIRPLAARSAEIVVRADSGETVVVVQTASDGFSVGDRVMLEAEGRARVAPVRR